MEGWLPWTIFGVLVLGMMVLDLGVFHRKAHEVTVKEALGWTAVWVAIGLAFAGYIRFFIDAPAIEAARASGAVLPEPLWVSYITCWLTEYALSVDNIFVFLVIFTYFGVPADSRHRVLFWGILGAMVMRAVFLVSGVALIERFHWTVYVLGAILILTAGKLLFSGDDEMEPEKNLVLRLAKRFLPVTDSYEGSRFFVVREGRKYATPLFLALLVVESTDVLFAVDSVPAALGISQDTFVLYTSNIFAILGLRSLFFAVAGLLKYLHYLKHGLSAILAFVGVKMLLPEEHKIPVQIALGVVGGILVLAIVASVVRAWLVKDKDEDGKGASS
ncbi:MAG: TerC family protein [Planctomycetes bacterium]|nr:TerC family protein [Planctomycetota bacterium]